MKNNKVINNRDIYWQNIRGICIIAVVCIHCSGYSDNYIFNEFNSVYYLIIRNLINFPVPCLFFLSGFFSKMSLYEQLDDKYTYIRRRLFKLLIPYLLFSFVYIIFQLLLLIRTHDHNSIYNYLLSVPKLIICGEAATPLYFTVVLSYFTLLTPLLFKILKTSNWKLPLLITPVITIFVYICKICFSYDLKYIVLSPIWISFYYFGILLSCKKIDFSKIKNRTVILLCLSSYFLEIIESLIIYNNTSVKSFAFSQMRITAFSYSFFIILILLVYKKKKYQRSILTTIGDYSYGIYMIHYLWLQTLWLIYNNIVLDLPVIFVQILEMVSCLIFSISICKIIRKLFGKYSYSLFGI